MYTSRIRFALLALVMMLAVSACGPKYVGQPVKVYGDRFAPMKLAVGETGEASIPLTHFTFDYKITRTGENTYSMKGLMHWHVDGYLSNGSFYLLLIKNGAVVGERSFRPLGITPEGDRIEADFESPEFDHVTSVYSIKYRRY